MADVIPFLLHRAEPDLAHYRVERDIGEETGITVRIQERIAWPHDLLVTLAGTFEGGSTVAALPAKEIATAMLVANATLAALEAAEITWNLQRIAGRR
ncbi:MAG: hypothetical protein INR62_08085 [Rhodospirillales bacterium]|nr:hypothetical protein [Acetobacter sp.]